MKRLSFSDLITGEVPLLDDAPVVAKEWWQPKHNLLMGCIPERHQRSVVRNQPQECDALTYVREFLLNEDVSALLLLGKPGTWKSGSACWAITQWLGSFHFVSSPEFCRLSTSRTEENEKAYRYAFKTELLIFDDLGTENHSDWNTGKISELVSHRYDACTKTIITSNLSVAEFKVRYGERLVDRIKETGIVVELAGASKRGNRSGKGRRSTDEPSP